VWVESSGGFSIKPRAHCAENGKRRSQKMTWRERWAEKEEESPERPRQLSVPRSGKDVLQAVQWKETEKNPIYLATDYNRFCHNLKTFQSPFFLSNSIPIGA
jgi:hypothetical protein